MGAPVPAASSRVRELLERIAVAAGVDAVVEITEDADGVTAAYVGEDLGESKGIIITINLLRTQH